MIGSNVRHVHETMQALSIGIGLGELKKKSAQPVHKPVVQMNDVFGEIVTTQTFPVVQSIKQPHTKIWHIITAFSFDVLLITATLMTLTVAVFYILDRPSAESGVGGVEEIDGSEVLDSNGAGVEKDTIIDVETVRSSFDSVWVLVRQLDFRGLFFGVLGISLIYFFLFRVLLGFTPGQGIQKLLDRPKKGGNY